MKFRRRNAPLVLLLVPLASALSAAARDNMQQTTLTSIPRDSTLGDSTASPALDGSKPKYEIGTKDAPVDGKDGKPHAGPFVGTDKESKLKVAPATLESILGEDKMADLVTPDGGKIPQANDGVMNDPSRELPKHGTTGTEGGYSEKDKVRKAQEGQTGEKIEKKPGSPKEAPSLPTSEVSKIKSDIESADDDGRSGLEVYFKTLNYWTFS